MKYRRTRAADRIQIKEECKKQGLSYRGDEPLIGFVAEGETGEIVGAAYAHKAAIIDPLFCPEPQALIKLLHQIEGALSALDFHNIVVQAQSTDKRLIQELKRLGFEPISQKFVTFRKI